MITLTVDGVEDQLLRLGTMQRQIPYAVANGLNATGRRVTSSIYTLMGLVFDRPTPFVLNSLQMTPARAPNGPLVTEVWFKDPPNLGTKGHFLLPQVKGGNRPMKLWEMGMGGKFFIIPSKYTPLDQHGNLGRGMITKLLALSGGFRESGFDMNTRDKSKAQKYFRLLTQRGKLPPGIYERVIGSEAGGRAGRFLLARAIIKKSKIKGALRELSQQTKQLQPRGARPMVLFAGKTPSYTKIFDFYGISRTVAEQYLPQDMESAITAEFGREVAYRASKFSRGY